LRCIKPDKDKKEEIIDLVPVTAEQEIVKKDRNTCTQKKNKKKKNKKKKRCKRDQVCDIF
jgi:hypothetical protein